MTTDTLSATAVLDVYADELYDPTGSQAAHVYQAAPRVRSLAGTTVALLSNQKRNADILLGHVADLLQQEHGVTATILDAKVAMSMPAPADQLRSLAGRAEVLVTAVGDCGSCSATSVMDAIAAEAYGIPSVPIVTEQFRSGAEMVTEIQGAEGFPIAFVEHPIATLDDAQLRDRARVAVGRIVDILTGA